MAGEWHEWEWDDTVFAGAAAYYEQGRLPYPPGLADASAALAGDVDGARLLDVGCGPGSVALRAAVRFPAVVGVDADAGMLAEGARLAAERGIANVRWEHLRAEELPAGLGTFRVVTFAQSLHWLDRPLVFATVRSMLESGGAAVHVDVGGGSLAATADGPAIPRPAIDALRQRYLGPERRAGQSIRISSPGDEDDVFRAAGFAGPELVPVPDGRTIDRTIDDVVAETFSFSSMAPHLFGNQVGAFEADLRAVLAAASPTGTFAVRVPDLTLKVWRPAQLTKFGA